MAVRLLTLLLSVTAAGLFGQTAVPPHYRTGDENKPDFPPSYTLHVSPSQTLGTREVGGMDYWSLQGFEIKDLVGLLYNENRIRIELPASLDDGKRYDFAMVVPKPEDQDGMKDRFRQGMLNYYHLVATREDRLMSVYVVTARDSALPLAKPLPTEGGMARSSRIGFECPECAKNPRGVAAKTKSLSISAITSISTEGTAEEFCHFFESNLDRPVVNETNLKGRFAFDIQEDREANNDFLGRLRRELGMVVTLGERHIEILVLRPR